MEWALPSDEPRGVSAWTRANEPNFVAAAVPDAFTSLVRARTSESLVDPPWAYSEEELAAAAADGQVRPAPSVADAPLTASTIQLVKKDGEYAVLLDGVEQAAVAAFDGVVRCWMPRFHERRVEVDGVLRRTVAPVFASVMVEEGESAPLETLVSVRQSIVEDGHYLMENKEVLRERLGSHTTDDLEVPTSTLMYPLILSQPPTVAIVDNDALRRHEFRKLKYNKSKTWAVISNLIAGLSDGGGGKAVGVSKAAWDELNKFYNRDPGTPYSPSGIFFTLVSVFTTPSLQRLLEAGYAYYAVKANVFDKENPPPTDVKTHFMSLSEFTAVLRRIRETRADGKLLKYPRLGLTPFELRADGKLEEAATLYWLVYGGGATTKDDAKGTGKTGNSPTGNELDARWLDPFVLQRTQLKYSIALTVTERDGRVRRFEFESVRASGFDAGYIAVGLDEQIKDLEYEVDLVASKLGKLNKLQNVNWLHDRLYVADATDGRVFGWLGGFTSKKDQMSKNSWWALTKAQRTDALRRDDDKRRIPLIIDTKAFKARLAGLIGSTESPDARKVRARARRPKLEVDGAQREGADAREAEFGKAVGQAISLYRRGMGWPASMEIADDDAGFVRWLDTMMPIGPRYEAALAYFVVPTWAPPTWAPPKSVFGRGGAPPAPPVPLVRRLPQVADFGATRAGATATALMPVRPVPDDELSDRLGAKSAVSSARQLVARAAVDFRAAPWVLEERGVFGGAPVFHFVQLYAAGEAPDRRLSSLPAVRRAGCTVGAFGLATASTEETVATEAEAEAALSEAALRRRELAAGARRGGDAAVLEELGLPTDRVSLSALRAYVQIVAHKATARAAFLKRGDLVQSVVLEADRAAGRVARLVEIVYGASSQRDTFVSRDDLLFGCLPDGEHARVALDCLEHWRAADPRAPWSSASRALTTSFAGALRRLSARKRLHPVQLPFVVVQSLWFADNPHPSELPGLETQLRAALQSMARVRELLESSVGSLTMAHAAALCAVVGARPVLLTAWLPHADREHVLRALGGGVGRRELRGVEPPRPVASGAALRERCAGMRLDAAESLRLGSAQPDLRLDDDDLVERVTRLRLGREVTAVYFVPPGSPAVSGVLDLSHMAAIEDQPVWMDALAREGVATVEDLGSAQVKVWAGQSPAPQVLVQGATVDGRARHPFEITVGAREWTVFLARTPPLAVELAEPYTGGATAEAVVDFMQARASGALPGGAASLTTALRERSSAVLFNVDRWWQLLMLCEAHRLGPRDALVAEVESSMDVVAYAIARSMRSTTFDGGVDVTFRVADAAAVAAAEDALAQLRGIASSVSDVAAVPLCELALCVAASIAR